MTSRPGGPHQRGQAGHAGHGADHRQRQRRARHPERQREREPDDDRAGQGTTRRHLEQYKAAPPRAHAVEEFLNGPEWLAHRRQTARAATQLSTAIIPSITASTYCQMCCRSSVSCAWSRAPA